MAGGEVCFDVFTAPSARVIPATRPDVPAFKLKQCCFKLPVLAQTLDDINTDGFDSVKNDKHSVLAKYDKDIYLNVEIVLQKYVNGDWADQVTFDNDVYGKNYSYGSMTSSDDRLNYVGYVIEWFNVLDSFGEGTYRFKFAETDRNSTETESYHLFEFCVKRYLPHRADWTVRFTWFTKGYRGDVFNDEDIWDYISPASKSDYADGWVNEIRLPDSFFGDNKSDYEREVLRYSNGQEKWIKDEQSESYAYHSGMFPSELHQYIKTEIVQADRILVTDYNSRNPNVFVDKAIRPSGGYEPSWNYNNLRAMVSVEFEQEFKNRIKRRC